jgi:hypothetical protein
MAWQLALQATLFALLGPVIWTLLEQTSQFPQFSLAWNSFAPAMLGYVVTWPATLIAAVTFAVVVNRISLHLQQVKSGVIRNATAGAVAGGVGAALAALAVALYLLYADPSHSRGTTAFQTLAWLGPLAGFFLASGAICGALVSALSAPWIGAVVLSVYIATFVSFKLYERDFRLSLVPDGLHVSSVIYAKEESWGLPLFPLPGDNETGLIVYELPLSTAQVLEKRGIEYLRTLPPNAGDDRDWRGRYEEWRPTPLSDPHWLKDPISDAAFSTAHVRSYLYKYGFGIDVDSDIEALIDEAIAKPGSYYAYGRLGVLIVIPSKLRVVYAYAG